MQQVAYCGLLNWYVWRAARVTTWSMHCCTSCIPPSSARSLQTTVYIFTCMPTTPNLPQHIVEDASLAFNKFTTCVTHVNAWLSVNRLRLNASKTQLMWLGSTQLLDMMMISCTHISVLGTHVVVSESVRDLGVVIDREMSLAAHAVC